MLTPTDRENCSSTGNVCFFSVEFSCSICVFWAMIFSFVACENRCTLHVINIYRQCTRISSETKILYLNIHLNKYLYFDIATMLD